MQKLVAVEAHRRSQQTLLAVLLRLLRISFGRVDPTAVMPSWEVTKRPLLAQVGMLQAHAATTAIQYMDEVVAELDLDADPVADLVAAAFGGYASDGRSLSSLLDQPLISMEEALVRGERLPDVQKSTLDQLERIGATQLSDAGRSAEFTAMVTRPTITMYVRMLSLASCSRCVILAGRKYKLAEAFLRHPNCDCRHIPATESIAGDLTTDPMVAFRSGMVRGLTKAEESAISDGADIGQVVNTWRGRAKGGLSTTEGTSKGGYAGRVRREVNRQLIDSGGRSRAPRLRLTPRAIYLQAQNRDEARRLLAANGYIMPRPGERIAGVARRALP